MTITIQQRDKMDAFELFDLVKFLLEDSPAIGDDTELNDIINDAYELMERATYRQFQLNQEAAEADTYDGGIFDFNTSRGCKH